MEANKPKFKIKKVFIDYSNPMTILGYPIFLKEPKYEVYRQLSLFFGIVKYYEYRITLSSDPKTFLNVIESNY